MLDPKSISTSDVEAINAQASTLMKQGIQLMNEVRAGAIVEALIHFDRALELRRHLPIKSNSLLGYGLAACWLNRADALVRLGGAEQISDALRSFDEAVALLRTLPLGEDERFPRRLAIACQNRGLAFLAQTPPAFPNAVTSFADAIATLDQDYSAHIPDRMYLVAVVCVNLANVRASERTAESNALARDAALRAVAAVKDFENDDAGAAEAGLKARHALCRSIAGHLSKGSTVEGPMPDNVHEATDIVDDGLSLVRRWEKRGVDRFREVAFDLLRFGARVYKRYQPQFLEEFLLDNLDPNESSSDYVARVGRIVAGEEAL